MWSVTRPTDKDTSTTHKNTAAVAALTRTAPVDGDTTRHSASDGGLTVVVGGLEEVTSLPVTADEGGGRVGLGPRGIEDEGGLGVLVPASPRGGGGVEYLPSLSIGGWMNWKRKNNFKPSRASW